MSNHEKEEAAELLPGTELMEIVVREYVSINNIHPKGLSRWARAFPTGSVLTYENNFEIVYVPFFKQNHVKDFISYIEDSLGIFLYRWGDAGIRYVTLALFAEDDEVISRDHFNMKYQHPC